MSFLEIIALIVFPIALSSYGLILEQKKIPLADKILMFRSEVFSNIIFFPSFLLMIATGIILLLYSWKTLVAVFIATAIFYPIVGRKLISTFWSVPYYFLDKWAEKKK